MMETNVLFCPSKKVFWYNIAYNNGEYSENLIFMVTI